MEILLSIIVILIFVAVLLMTFINVILLVFGETQAAQNPEQPEVNVTNNFQNFTP